MLFDIISRQDFCDLQTDRIYFFGVRLHCHTELVVRCQSKKHKVKQCVVFHTEYLKGYLLRLSRVTSHRSNNNGVSNFSLNTSRDTWGRLTTYPHGIVGNVRCSHRDRMTFVGLSPCIRGASLLGSHHEPLLRTQVKWAEERYMTRARTPGLVTGRRTDLLLRTVLELPKNKFAERPPHVLQIYVRT